MTDKFFNTKKWALYCALATAPLTVQGSANSLQSNPKDALMLRRITEYWKDGDYATVKRQIQDYLEKNPQTPLHDHLNAMLGDLHFQEKNYRNALATYDLIGDPEIREKTFFNHLQAHFELRDYQNVIQKSETFMKHRKGSDEELEIKVRYLLAESSFRLALGSKDQEQKAHFLKLAKPHYKLLTQTKFSERALFPLAEIHRLLKENERAASLYLSLAEKYPQHQERFLFQAAILQIQTNKSEAVGAFSKVAALGGKRARLATFNQLVLLYQMEKYDAFLTLYQEVIGTMPSDKASLLRFYEGRCHYYLGDYAQAMLPLEQFVVETKEKSKELKTAYLLLVNCSRYLKDTPLLERTMYSFKTSFPGEREVAQILMMHAQMCRESGNYNQALTDLKMILNEYPDYQDKEALEYDFGLLLTQMEKWDDAREAFMVFLEHHPQSEKTPAAWRHLLNCCINQIQQPENPTSTHSKEMLISLLQKALTQDQVLNAQEKERFTLVLMKCQCELGYYSQVIPTLTQYLADVTDSDTLAEAHLLMAICQQKTNSDLGKFIQHAELALTHNSKLPENKVLHLELFNAYLSKGMTTENAQSRKFFVDSAASHLFASESWKERNIKLDNFLWLVNHYYEKGMKGEKESFEIATTLFHNLLGIQEGKELTHLNPDALYLEAEVLKFAHMLEKNGKSQEQINVLEMLAKKQQEILEAPWKLKRRTKLELARAYERDHQYQNAISGYQYLIQTADRASTMVTHAAQLHKANLDFKLLQPQHKRADSPEVISILHTLKDLQIQKKLTSEPVHLEAALRYAEIRSQLAEPTNDPKNRHFFLKRIVDDFTKVSDPVLEEYKQKLSESAEKKSIYQAYMSYIRAQMHECEAALAIAQKQGDKANALKTQALEIYGALLNQSEALYPYLYNRVQEAKEGIEL